MTKYFNGFEGAAGDTAYSGSTGASTGTGTQSSNPAPSSGIGGSSYGVCTAAAGTLGFNRWTLDTVGAWQFRRLIYLGAGTGTNGAVNADVDIVRTLQNSSGSLATAGLVRVASTGFLSLRDSAATAVSGGTSTVAVPTGGWYRLEGYGNSVNNTGRVALFAVGSASPIIDLAPSTWNQGAFGLGQVQLGKPGNGTGYAGLVAFDLEEFYTGADATSAFLGPYAAAAVALASTTTVGTSTSSQGVSVTVAANTTVYSSINTSGGTGNTITYDWAWGDGATTGAQASSSASHTYTTAGTYTVTGAANQT